MGSRPLSAALLEGLDEDAASRFAGLSGLEDRLASIVAEGASAWPTVELAPTALVAYLAARLEGAADAAETLERMRAVDLFIACACAGGDSAALEAFEAEYFGEVDAAMARVRDAPIGRSELRQLMRQRFFVSASDAPPRIASYLGKGDLHGWVRISATRVLLDLVRKPARDVPMDDFQVGELATAGDDPEVAFLKQQYRADFKRAFAQSMAALTPRQRNMLRHRYVHGLSVEEVATVYGVHRVTASRSLTRAQDALQAGIRRFFMAHLDIGRAELASVMGLIASQLDLSLSRLLKTAQPG